MPRNLYEQNGKENSAASPQYLPREKTYLRSIVSTVLLLCLLSIPFWMSVVISLKDYHPMRGVFGSPWIGLQNVEDFLSRPYASNVTRNSFLLWGLGLCASLIMGVPLGMLAASIRRPAWRALAAGFLLVPVFVPDICWALLFRMLLPIGMYVNAEMFPALYLTHTLIPGACMVAFCTAAIGAMAGNGSRRPALYGAGIGALLYALTFLSPNAEMIRLIQSPMNYETSDVLSTYIYRSGLIEADYGFSMSVYLFKTILQILIGVVPAVFLARILRHSTAAHMDERLDDAQGRADIGMISFLLSAAVVVFLLIAPVFGKVSTQAVAGEQGSVTVGRAGLNSAVYALAACAIGFPVSLMMVIAFSRLRVFGIAFLALLLLAPAGNIMGEYLCFRWLGWLGTMWPVALGVLFSPKAIFLSLMCAVILRYKYGRDARLNEALPLALIPLLFVASSVYGDAAQTMVYIMRAESFNLGIALREAVMRADVPDWEGMFYAVTIPCLASGVGAGLLFAKFARK